MKRRNVTAVNFFVFSNATSTPSFTTHFILRFARCREEALAQLNAERKHFDASSSISTEPLDRDNPGVNILEDNVRNKATTINNCSFSVEIHEEPEAFLDALVGEQVKVGKALFQKTVEEGVTYWSLMVTNTKSCDLLLRMRVERQDSEEIIIRVESVEEEGESREGEDARTLNPSAVLSFLTPTSHIFCRT